jgi:hypothetical protein
MQRETSPQPRKEELCWGPWERGPIISWWGEALPDDAR